MLRPGDLGSGRRRPLAGGQLLLQFRGFPGEARRHQVPAGSGRARGIRPHAEFLRPGAAAHVRHPSRGSPDGARIGAIARGPPSLLGRRSGDRASLGAAMPPSPTRATARAPRTVQPLSYKVYLFLAVVALMAALMVHSNVVIARLNNETENLCGVLARFLAVSTFQAAEDPALSSIFREVVAQIHFPIVLTDQRGIPRAWKEIGFPASAVRDTVLQLAWETGRIPP